MTIGSDLRELEVPEHRPGFFEDLGAELGRLSARGFDRRRLALALAAALVVAAAVVGVLVTRGTRPVRPNPATPGAVQPWTDFGSNPWGDHGRQTTVHDLRAGVPEIPLPSSPSANDDNAGGVWVWGDPSSGHVAAAIYYPQAKIELLWTATGLDYTGFDAAQQPTIDGVHAILLGPETYGSGLSVLDLPVGPAHVLMLEGFVSTTDLVTMAKTLIPSPGDASPAGDLPPQDPQPGPELTFWDGLLKDAVSTNSVDDAAGSLGFQPIAPSSLGDPSAILETDPAHAPVADRVLSLRYDDPSSDRFWVVERPSLDTTTALLSKIAADCTRASGCKEEVASMVDLGNGVSALNLENPVTERIVWVENGVYFEVAGNASTFSGTKAQSVAKAVAAG